MTYLTATGMKVRSIGPMVVRGGRRLVPCVRAATGGWHGFLRRDRLKPYRKRKR